MKRTHAQVYTLLNDLYSRYCFAADLLDAELIERCFGDHSEFGLKGQEPTIGAQPILTRLSNGWKEGVIHHTFNLMIDEIDGDQVYSRANFTKISEQGGIVAAGTYEDIVQLGPDSAQFNKRAISFLWNNV